MKLYMGSTTSNGDTLMKREDHVPIPWLILLSIGWILAALSSCSLVPEDINDVMLRAGPPTAASEVDGGRVYLWTRGECTASVLVRDGLVADVAYDGPCDKLKEKLDL